MSSRRLPRLAVAAVAAGAILPPAAHASPGGLDATFGTGGVVVDATHAAAPDVDVSAFRSLTLLGDGRPVVWMSERCGMECSAPVIARYTVAGAPDASVPGPPAGVIRPAPSGREVITAGVAVAPDGALRVGYAGEAPSLVDVAPDGTVGVIRATAEPVAPLSLAADGTSLVRLGVNGRVITRLLPDGAPDAGFGHAGGREIPAAIIGQGAVDDGGALRVGGAGRLGPVLWRAPLAGGGVPRVTQVPLGPGWRRASGAGPFAVGASGRTVQVGLVGSWPARGAVHWRSAVAVFRPDGRVDRGFGDGGVVWLAQQAIGVAVQDDGKVVLVLRAGADGAPATGPATVRRLNADGSADPSFASTPIPSGDHRAVGAAGVRIDQAGRMVVAFGARTPAGAGALVLARMETGDAAAMRITGARRAGAGALRLVATSSMAGTARIAVRQGGRIVGATNVRFSRGSQRAVRITLRGARPNGSLRLAGTFRGASATGVLRVGVNP